MNTRLSFVTSLGAVVAVLGGLTPACGSDASRPRGMILEGGVSGGGGGGNAAGGSTGNSGGSSGSTGSSSLIGQPCLKATDCGTEGLTCLADSGSEFNGGGVSHGICTLDCSADLTAVVSADSTCAKVDATAICLQITTSTAYCVESCTVGTSSTSTATTSDKCHGRKDMACADPRDRGIGFCKPTCRGDFDCGTRLCDLSSGVCVDKLDPARKLPIGSKCDPNADVDPCEGACVGILEGDAATTQVGFCSGYCQLGEQNGCGFDPNATSVDAFCLFGTSQASGFQDLGFCAQVCDCNDDCLNPDFICSTVSGLSGLISRPGACGPRSSASKTEPNGIVCKGTRPKPDSGKHPVPPPDASTEAGVVVPPDAGAPHPVDAGTKG